MLASTTHCQWNTETADFRAPLMQDGPDRKTTTTCANSYYLCCDVPLTRGGLAAPGTYTAVKTPLWQKIKK